MKGLPSSVNVERFTEARAFEIRAMQEAMKSASSSSTTRAWQELPRHLRRRAASHDVSRVPIRLRQKARAEMDPMRRKILGRTLPKRGKSRREPALSKFEKRQANKTWLESHLWHAKRMIMEDMWGYRLAMEPTEKSFRPSHRASVHGSILHDASYYSLIQLNGPEVVLKALLERCCDPQLCGPGAQRYLTGAIACDTEFYQPNSYPFALIGPVTILWQPLPFAPMPSTSQPETTVSETNNRKRKRAVKKKIPSAAPTQVTDSERIRVVWIRCHPLFAKEAIVALKKAVSLTVEAFNISKQHKDKSYTVEVTDLRGEFNIFEIMGPKSSQVIKGALSPIPEGQRNEFTKFWDSLTNLQTAGSVPRNMVIGFTTLDPRLSFPPKNAKAQVSRTQLLSIPPPCTSFPSSTLAQSDIWNETLRAKLKTPRHKKKSIDARKGQNVIPGSHLKPTKDDDQIPVLLIQRSTQSYPLLDRSSTANDRLAGDPSLHGWTLILPKGWSMAFLSSLIYTGTRVGGQRERQHQSFESGVPYFPRDFPSTTAYESYADTRARKDLERWCLKPPAKRPNWGKLGTRSPWKPDWGSVLISTQRDNQGEKEELDKLWLLRGPDAPSIVDSASKLLIPSTAVLHKINQLRLKRNMEVLGSTINGDDLFKRALVQIRAKLISRGSPDDLAAVYLVDDQEALRWKAFGGRKDFGLQCTPEHTGGEVELTQIIPSQDDIVGYVTSGNYSLSRGQGYAIGAISLAKLCQIIEQSKRLQLVGSLVKLRNRDGVICRAAYIEILDS
ncbi:RNase P [Heterobasidion irregulare TC 32-1]|uniref:RNase P n=1 Tax=Heterobasidion irregulare (strain TC 32-1) TaxID=747525 RepID=W4K7E0_HETIT|nr:RNase P [Heterobasidion irregulare TC 32-1]ETW81747.1 RNase P [Heterobasidion irregulare TC 32-1]